MRDIDDMNVGGAEAVPDEAAREEAARAAAQLGGDLKVLAQCLAEPEAYIPLRLMTDADWLELMIVISGNRAGIHGTIDRIPSAFASAHGVEDADLGSLLVLRSCGLAELPAVVAGLIDELGREAESATISGCLVVIDPDADQDRVASLNPRAFYDDPPWEEPARAAPQWGQRPVGGSAVSVLAADFELEPLIVHGCDDCPHGLSLAVEFIPSGSAFAGELRRQLSEDLTRFAHWRGRRVEQGGRPGQRGSAADGRSATWGEPGPGSAWQ
ncbi:hypothetical protein NQ038_08240 [Brevibacterium sp. 50QC2O2]|uniref:hypothetical protein n=1 Tax=Brevibacterium sp. 50QC2O2 TaxID=2968459 RepID=UPI00211CF346|nr:hypothetical protein [Brevibacterium sp. 50QC2O2]MCQ9388635.1 hypothetical protein [Brevibacterium sp. 50QC2O2]